MLTSGQRRTFDLDGFVRIPGAFTREEAGIMVDLLKRTLIDLHGIDLDDPATWDRGHPTGLQEIRESREFSAIGSEVTTGAIDGLLGPGRWKRPHHWGQILITFPSREPWSVPHEIWHTDFGFLDPPDPLPGLLVFSFLSDVPPGSGGTGVVAGSHRAMAEFVKRQPRRVLEKMKRVRKAFMASDPWLVSLADPRNSTNRTIRFMEEGGRIGGIPVRVDELSGEAGDIVVGHPWLLHASTLNSEESPRLMCVQRIHARESSGEDPEEAGGEMEP